MPDQLNLFGDRPEPAGSAGARRLRGADGANEALDRRFATLRPVAAALPPNIRFGTSSWSFPGWEGLVYPRRASAAALSRDGLADYVRHPLLATVGLDRTFYGPVPEADLARYASQLPDGFPCCMKAPSAVTSAVRPTGAAGPSRGADPNPAFLSADRFIDELLEPVTRSFAAHAGPFILQFPPVPKAARLTPSAFAERLDRFLDDLPGGFSYAVEIRQRDLLGPDYAGVLARHRAAHVYNLWTAMPLPGAQADSIAPEAQPFVVVRLLLRPGATYDEQREAFSPFDRIQAPSEAMREQVVGILERAVKRQLPAFVLVNNKAEGCAPLTIEALARMLVGERSR